MFGTTTAYRFFQKAQGDFARVEADIADPGAALNCILSLYHLHEWVWATWLKKRSDVQARLGICGKKCKFVEWLDANCPHFALLQELANGTKHCKLIHRTDLRTEQIQGFGRGPYGIGPFGARHLLIDLGGDHPPAGRYLVASDVLKAIMDFWIRFFEEYGITDDA